MATGIKELAVRTDLRKFLNSMVPNVTYVVGQYDVRKHIGFQVWNVVPHGRPPAAFGMNLDEAVAFLLADDYPSVDYLVK